MISEATNKLYISSLSKSFPVLLAYRSSRTRVQKEMCGSTPEEDRRESIRSTTSFHHVPTSVVEMRVVTPRMRMSEVAVICATCRVSADGGGVAGRLEESDSSLVGGERILTSGSDEATF